MSLSDASTHIFEEPVLSLALEGFARPAGASGTTAAVHD
jgi:hypothetical protein